MRTCGDCTVCCFIGAVPALGKPAHTKCLHVSNQGCSIYKDRPDLCREFQCSWLRGAGLPEDRPDLSGVMCFASDPMKGEKYPFVHVIEVEEGAVLNKGKAIVERLTELSATPVVVVDYGSKPPNDYGDRVVIKAELEKRAQRMMGKFLQYLDADRRLGLYELVREGR